MAKRIGLISDTHGHLPASVAKYFDEVDEIWHAGDIGQLSVMDELNAIAPVKAVYGNIDGTEARAAYPEFLHFEEQGVSVFMIHIGGKPGYLVPRALELVKKHPSTVFICGHSHILRAQFDKRFNHLYLNPGAAGIHGFHKVKTLMRFVLEEGVIKNLEVIELGARA
ncbi:MAG: putative phosphoesterase [Flavobacteriales bacterium]|jgi:putative phosphoesterase